MRRWRGDGVSGRRKHSTSSTSCSHGIDWVAEEHVEIQRASKHFKTEEENRTEYLLHKTVNSSKRKQNWSQEEDEILIQLVNLHSPRGKWSTIACSMTGRNADQCRERWMFNLDPAVNRQPWSEQEEITLIHAHQIHGNKWSELAKLFPGRTGKAVKNHWAYLKNKEVKSHLVKELQKQFPHRLIDSLITNNKGPSTHKIAQDSSTDIHVSSEMLGSPKLEQALTGARRNPSTLNGKASDITHGTLLGLSRGSGSATNSNPMRRAQGPALEDIKDAAGGDHAMLDAEEIRNGPDENSGLSSLSAATPVTPVRVRVGERTRYRPESYLKDVRGLLTTGLLEGFKVIYKNNEVEKIGRISGQGYSCGCTECDYGGQVLNACEFEQHSGASSCNQNNHIFLETGISLYRVLKALKYYKLNVLGELIEEIIGLPPNMVEYIKWKDLYQKRKDDSDAAASDSCSTQRTGKAVKNHWACLKNKEVKSHLAKGLPKQFPHRLIDSVITNNKGPSTNKIVQDSSTNIHVSSEMPVTPKLEQVLTGAGRNPSTLNVKTSHITHVTEESLDRKVPFAVASFPRSQQEEEMTDFVAVRPNSVTKDVSPACNLLSNIDNSDVVCSSADPESQDPHLANLADLLDMSYCESLMIIAPDSPNDGDSMLGL